MSLADFSVEIAAWGVENESVRFGHANDHEELSALISGMSPLFFVGIVVGCGYLFYLKMCAVTWDETERRRLFQEELHLGHLLELMEARDIRQMVADPLQRSSLFQSFSAFLLEDVSNLVKKYPVGPVGLCRLSLFYLGYAVIKAKSWIRWGREDLHFLAGLELALIRSLRGN